ncbi:MULTISPECIES: helix-turn-helix domain-containing protein [Hyphomicrobiales]|jgi:predicted DNA-binding transcriptional regulator AlpA|uniref:helix-turn-helix domain-containing protein n=1 Tax=Methylobacterium sp. CCH7-A2 TaxID=1768789 RepID=UPI000834A1BA|nr:MULTISPECIES: helix-turn-helix domain-containing protein [Hyphomicrobiales]
MSTAKFDTAEAANYIGKSASWLNKTRLNGTGPVYLKIGGSVRYDRRDLDAFLAGARRTAVYDHANDNARAARAA